MVSRLKVGYCWEATPPRVGCMFSRLKDWRRIATRYDRCAHTFFSSICIAASLAFYLNQ
jgi:hypothetical protein